MMFMMMLSLFAATIGSMDDSSMTARRCQCCVLTPPGEVPQKARHPHFLIHSSVGIVLQRICIRWNYAVFSGLSTRVRPLNTAETPTCRGVCFNNMGLCARMLRRDPTFDSNAAMWTVTLANGEVINPCQVSKCPNFRSWKSGRAC